jgi:exosortase
MPLGVGVAAVLGIYAPLVPAMVAEWAEFPSLSHGFAIPMIAAYLIWGRRERIASEPLSSSPLGLPLVVAGLALLVVGSLGGEPFVARLSLPLILLGAVLFLAGPGVTRHVWMGIAYLLFMIPLPYVTMKGLTYQSQLFDAGISAQALAWLGVPVLRDGVFLHLPNITLEVAAACSSVPAIAALTALGAAYAQASPRPTWVRLTLILAAAPLGLASNIVRIVLTALGAYHLGRIALDNVIHKFNGTTVFLATVLLLILLDVVLLRLARTRRR